jgi:hypothetical protein
VTEDQNAASQAVRCKFHCRQLGGCWVFGERRLSA